MDIDWIPRWWIVFLTVLGFASSAITLWLSKTFARREDMKKVESGMDELNTRVTGLEERVDSLPTPEQISALRLEMMEMRGDIKALREALHPVNHMAKLLLEHQLKEK